MIDRHPGNAQPARHSNAEHWAYRALACATLAILVCTLFPFEFFRPETATCRLGSFWCCFSPLPGELRDFLENILLFMPFGFAWACWGCRKGWGRFWSTGVALVAGAGLSFTVEFLQIFLPTREASWSDVLANTFGSLLGHSLFAIIGNRVLSIASHWGAGLERILTPRRIVAIFVAYAALGCGVSAELQRSTNLSHWHPSDGLRFETGPSGSHYWHGRILEAELASRALLPEASRKAARQSSDRASGYAGVPFPEERGGPADARAGTAFPAATLMEEIQKTNQFTLRIRCTPADFGARAFGVILFLPDYAGYDDFDLIQRGRDVTLVLRTPDLGQSGRWDLHLEDVFKDPEPSEFILIYDGADLFGYVNGRKTPHPVRLSPGPILVGRFKGINPKNLPGYAITYDLVIFAPLGVLLGFAVRKPFSKPFFSRTLLASGLFLPSLLEELILAGVSGRPFQFGNLILGICLTLTTWLVLNSGLRNSSGFPATQTCDARMVAESFLRNAALDFPTDSSSPKSS
jgi:glycopeptide antibiotics resistance protein